MSHRSMSMSLSSPSDRSLPLKLVLFILGLCLILPAILFFLLIHRSSSSSTEHFTRLSLIDYPRARCMDQSIAAYYRYAVLGRRRWLIYFDGGWFCSSEESCRFRRQYSFSFVTSSDLNRQEIFRGIFATFKDEHYNLIYVPYCSSDLWLGSSNDSSSHGSEIFQAVLEDQKYFLDAEQVVFIGFSAGGLGLLMNFPGVVDRFSSRTDLRLILDSAWLIDYPNLVGMISKIDEGLTYWNARLPIACRSEARHRCLLGTEAIERLPSSMHIVLLQSLFDYTQLHFDQLYSDLSDFSSTLLVNLHRSTRRLSIFAPACSSHGFLFHPHWSKFDIQQITLRSLLHRWLTTATPSPFHLIDEQSQASVCPSASNERHVVIAE